MNESDWQSRVVDWATRRGWRVHHTRPARTAKGWRTPIQGHPGWPDLAMARAGRLILAELKADGEYPTPEQRAWLEALPGFAPDVEVHVWRPKDWPEVQAALR